LGCISIDFSGVSEFFLSGNFGVAYFKSSGVGINSSLGLVNSIPRNFKESFECSDFLVVGSMSGGFRFYKVIMEII
jgi:hypothetical protein